MLNKLVKTDWDKEFVRDYPISNFQEISNYWWIDCYDQIEGFLLENFFVDKNTKILECGSGSGNSSLRLANKVKEVVLLDNSESAIECSKKLALHYKIKNVNFIKGDIFAIPWIKEFELCWNVGVLEHYENYKAQELVKKMMQSTKNGGHVILGVPNFFSLALIKARVLAVNFLRPVTFWIKGYRLHDEIRYNIDDVERIFFRAAKDLNVELLNFRYDFVGNFLPVETPEAVYNFINRFGRKFFKKFSFLIFFSAELKYIDK